MSQGIVQNEDQEAFAWQTLIWLSNWRQDRGGLTLHSCDQDPHIEVVA